MKKPLANSTHCTRSTDALAFWRAQIGNQANSAGIWVLALDRDRRFTGCQAVKSKAFGDAERFADELFQANDLRKACELVVVSHQPGANLAAIPSAVAARVRAVILAGRARKIGLLDWIVVGKPDEAHLTGTFSFYRLRGFSAEIPFAKSGKKACKNKVKSQFQP